MPRIFWKTASLRCGLNIADLIESANNYKSANNFNDKDNKFMKHLMLNIIQYIEDPRRCRKRHPRNLFQRYFLAFVPYFGRHLGNYLVALYLLLKIISLLNSIAQVILSSAILGYNYIDFGVHFFKKLLNGDGWIVESKYFPKTALCDFKIREVGNPLKNHRYTVQCVLPINLFNQQIFTVVWFWYLLLILANFFELIKCIIRFSSYKSSNWIKRRVLLYHPQQMPFDEPNKSINQFTNDYLKADGIFMLQLIANNVNEYVATNLMQELWNKFYEKCEYEKKINENEPSYLVVNIDNNNDNKNETPSFQKISN